MKTSTRMIKDPICGMTVDETTAIHSQRDGKTSYFCGEQCRQKFLAAPSGSGKKEKPGNCCG